MAELFSAATSFARRAARSSRSGSATVAASRSPWLARITDASNAYVSDTIYLFKISDTVIEGRVDLNNDGMFNDVNGVALRFTLDLASPSNPVL